VLGIAHLAGVGIGLWSAESISQRWILDRTFEPRMSADERESIYKGWQDAVAAARSLPNRG
jgi:glycerol kinase